LHLLACMFGPQYTEAVVMGPWTQDSCLRVSPSHSIIWVVSTVSLLRVDVFPFALALTRSLPFRLSPGLQKSHLLGLPPCTTYVAARVSFPWVLLSLPLLACHWQSLNALKIWTPIASLFLRW
jgi:hypothetical protein